MIRLGQLPVILMVGEKEWKIRTDYRDILVIMQAYVIYRWRCERSAFR